MKRNRYEEDSDRKLESSSVKDIDSKRRKKLSGDSSPSQPFFELNNRVPTSRETYTDKTPDSGAVLADASTFFDEDDMRNIVKGFLPRNDRRAIAQTNKSCMKTAVIREDEVRSSLD